VTNRNIEGGGLKMVIVNTLIGSHTLRVDWYHPGTSAGFWFGVKTIWKFDYEMVHSEVYLNKYVVSIAPFSTPACPDALKISHKHRKLFFFACFRFLIFHPFSRGVSWPHLPLWYHRHAAVVTADVPEIAVRTPESSMVCVDPPVGLSWVGSGWVG